MALSSPPGLTAALSMLLLVACQPGPGPESVPTSEVPSTAPTPQAALGRNVFRLGRFEGWTVYKVVLDGRESCLARIDRVETSYQRGAIAIPFEETGLDRGDVFYSVGPDPDLGEIHYYNAGVPIADLSEVALFAGPEPTKYRFKRFQETTAFPEAPSQATEITREILRSPVFYMAAVTKEGVTVFDRIDASGLGRALEAARTECGE